MKRKNTILLACLGLAFSLSFILNNNSFAGFMDPTGPLPGEGSCTMTGEFIKHYSTMDGPPTVSSCFNCIAYETIPVYMGGVQIGMSYKRRYEVVDGLVQSCKYSNIYERSCTATFWVGGATSCDDYIDYTDTGTDSDTL